MEAKTKHEQSVYQELITLEIAAEKMDGTDEDAEEYLDNIRKRLEEKNEFDEAKFDKNKGCLFITTKEGYKFAVIGDRVILADEENNNNTEVPVIKESDIKFKTVPSYWTNTDVTLELSSPTHPFWTIEYSEDGTNWSEYQGKMVIKNNKTIHALLKNDAGESKPISRTITNIDRTAPTLTSSSFKVSKTTTRGFTLELEVQDTESGLAQITWNYKLRGDTKWTKNVTDVYHSMHTSDQGDRSLVKKSHSFDKIASGSYVVQANIYDVAGNVTSTNEIEITIGKIDDVADINQGSFTYSPKTWTNGSVTVTLPTVSTLETRYTTNGTVPTVSSSKYDPAHPITVTGNTRIYYIYTDGVNISKCATKEVTNIEKDPVSIDGSIYISNIVVRGFTLNVDVQDNPSTNASGISEVVWNYRKKGEANWISESQIYKARPSEQAGERGKVTKSKTFNDMPTGIYEAFVDVYDVAGNKTTSKVEEFNIGIAEEVGNGTYAPTYWTNSGVTVTLPVAPEGLRTVFTKNGSVPTKDSEEYVGPFTVNSNCTINYVYTDGININTAKSLNITNIESKKPEITLALKESNVTTNGFTLSVSARDTDAQVSNASGLSKIVIYYKKNGDANWTALTENYKDLHSTTNGSRVVETVTKTVSNAASGTYQAYVEVQDVAGNVTSTSESPISFSLGTITDPGNASYNPSYWTNGNVTVTLPTAPSGLKTVFTRDGSVPNSSSEEYTAPFAVNSNCTINYVYTDGTNISSPKTRTVTNIDKKNPDIRTDLDKTNVTTKGFTLSISVQDTDTTISNASGLSKIVWYYKLKTASSWTDATTDYKAINSTTNGSRDVTNATKVIDGLSNGTYQAYAEVYDVAGNKATSGTIEITLGSMPTIGSSSFSPSGWTNGDVTVTLPTAAGYTTKYTTNGSTPTVSSASYSSPITVSSNCTVNYIYTDGTNVNTAGSRAITNIDTKLPNITTALASSNITSKGFTLTMSVQDTDTTFANASGLSKIVWHYKLSTASSWTDATTNYVTMNGTTNGSRDVVNATTTATNLATGLYQAYAEVYDVAGNKATSETIEITLGSIPVVGSSSFSPSGWTNGAVTVTLPTATGYTTKYTTNGTAPTVSSTAYSSPFTVSSNCIVNYIYTDGTNINTAGTRNITNIDTKLPTITTALASSGVTSKGFTLTMSVQDTDTTVTNASGLSKIIWYYRVKNTGNYTALTTNYITMNGATAGSRSVTDATKDITNLASGTYQAYAEVYDVAGNKATSSTIEITLGSIPTIGSSSFTPSGWTNGTVTVTLPTTSGYTTRYTTNGTAPTVSSTAYSSPFTVSSNCTVNYIYTDGTNINTAGSKSITNIDTTAPSIGTQLSESSKTTTSITLTITVTDTASGLGKIVWYYKANSASSWSSKEEVYTTLNGTTAGAKTATTKTYTFSGLTQNTKYDFYAVVYDVAGNPVSSKSAASPLQITTPIQAVTSVAISPSGSLEKGIGDTFTITPTVGPSNANNKNVNWTSSNTAVATVSSTSTASGTAVTVTCKAAGSTNIVATAADGSGKSATLVLTVVKTYKWGDYVNYPITLGLNNSTHTLIDGTIPKTDWRIFYKDSTYTYLIAADYIPTSKFPSGVFTANNGSYNGYWSSAPTARTVATTYKNRFLWNSLGTVSTSNANYKCSTYLLDSTLWTSMVNSTYADAAIGSPTLEMLVASWNAEYPTQKLKFGVNSTGYQIAKESGSLTTWISVADYEGFDNTLYYPHNKPGSTSTWNSCYGYWLASPSSGSTNDVMLMHCGGSVSSYNCTGNGYGVRPVVCLKSTVNMTKDANGVWQLK